MNRIIKFNCSILILVLISACAQIEQRRYEYLASRNDEQLILPQDLNKRNISNYYVLSDRKQRATTTELPPNSKLAKNSPTETKKAIFEPNSQELRFAEIKGRLVLKINQPFENAWPRVAAGLKKQKILISRSRRNLERYEIFDTYVTDWKRTENTPIYYLQVKPQGEETWLSITNTKGKSINRHRAGRLLVTIAKGMQGNAKFSLFN